MEKVNQKKMKTFISPPPNNYVELQSIVLNEA